MERIKTIFIFILIAFCLMQSCFITNQQNKRNELLEYIEQKSTEETYTHYISDVIFDTVFQDKYIPYYEIDTVILTDTITNTTTDTLILKDTVYLPNEISIKDTTFLDTLNNQIINNQLYIKLSGFQTSIDTLCLNTSITSIKQNPKWYERIVPSAGIGIGVNGKLGVFMGIGYRLN
jgi:hypothetical protein